MNRQVHRLVYHTVSLEKLFLVVDGNKHRNPKLDNVWRVRNFGELGPKWDTFIKTLLLRLNDLSKRGGGQ